MPNLEELSNKLNYEILENHTKQNKELSIKIENDEFWLKKVKGKSIVLIIILIIDLIIIGYLTSFLWEMLNKDIFFKGDHFMHDTFYWKFLIIDNLPFIGYLLYFLITFPGLVIKRKQLKKEIIMNKRKQEELRVSLNKFY